MSTINRGGMLVPEYQKRAGVLKYVAIYVDSDKGRVLWGEFDTRDAIDRAKIEQWTKAVRDDGHDDPTVTVSYPPLPFK